MGNLVIPRRKSYPPSRRPRHSLFRNRQMDSGEPFQHLINVSGGKDSTAVYLLALETGRPFRAVFADTGHEHEMTYDFVSRLSERTGGPPVEVVRADFSARLARHREYILREWPKQGIPEHIERVARWEAIVSATNKRRLSTFFAALKDPMDVDRPGTYAGIHTVVEWSRTSRGGRQYEMFFDGQTGSGCNSDLALCEWDEDRSHAIDLTGFAPPAP